MTDELKQEKLIKKVRQFGNTNVNGIIEYFMEKFDLPALDGTQVQNRRFAYLLFKKCDQDMDKVRKLIDLASIHKFWARRMTKIATLYYNMIAVVNETRPMPRKYVEYSSDKRTESNK